MKKRPSGCAWEKEYIRFISTYRLGEQRKESRKLIYKKASYLVGNKIFKPFRKR